MAENEHQVIIVGAGISGLSAAAELERNGVAPLVIDSSDRVGGRIQSDEVDGFIMDRGFQVILSSYEQTARLISGIKLSPFKSGALIWDGKSLNRLFDPRRHPSETLRSLAAKVFRAGDLFLLVRLLIQELPPGTTIDELVKFGFSPQALERFFKPFFSGVLLDSELRLPTESFNYAFRHFLKGEAQLPASGMRMIPETIVANKLKSTGIALNTKVVEVSRNEVTLANRRKLKAQAVVIATEPDEAASLLKLKTNSLWRGVTTFYFSADESPLGENVLVLNGSGSGVINTLCVPSDVAPGYAPDGKTLISVSSLHNVKEDEILKELELILGQTAKSYRHLKTYRVNKALPIVDSLEIADNLICGDYLGVPSIENAVRSGKSVAEYALRRL